MYSLKQVLEAIVFASPKAITLDEIRKALRGAAAETEELEVIAMGDATEEEIASQLNLLASEYEREGRAFSLSEGAMGWSYVTRPEGAQWVRQLYPESRPTRLSGPALETLAIIAYRQPVTRADIEAVRGVAVDGVMQVLLDRSLVKIAGRADLPGRPLLYETTEYFLQHFGLKQVDELPNADELRRVNLPKAEYADTKTAEAPTEPAAEPAATPLADETPATSGSDASAAEAAPDSAIDPVSDADAAQPEPSEPQP
ncbi:MAG: SMC-Scp complex subunit ScpB [Verrucomicrobiota bacterium]|jgi:segregation and condensation protein B